MISFIHDTSSSFLQWFTNTRLRLFWKKKKIPLNMEALLKALTATKQFTHKTRSLLPPLSINVIIGTKHHLYCKAAVLGSQWKTTTHPWNELFLPGATWLTLSFLLPNVPTMNSMWVNPALLFELSKALVIHLADKKQMPPFYTHKAQKMCGDLPYIFFFLLSSRNVLKLQHHSVDQSCPPASLKPGR